ncbi:MAG: phosphoribosylformylglycinamidine synthase subunit PurL [Firmicutes bacterium]|nr:phosphoribosylformylglycinamidine synthase subunit PurL [Bacillota bacterium]
MNFQEVGLTQSEYQTITAALKRSPNDLELGLFGLMWSEHCSYKSSKNLLSWLPHSGKDVLQGPGDNAGVVRLNEDWDVAFKVESHNHPSYVEPLQGAATGVGGILRDIFAMGARPVALADALRLGTDAHSALLQDGIVEGIGAYGNTIGIPTVSGDVEYAPTYNHNPLVNVLAVGLRRHGRSIGARGARPGSRIYLLGQKTGRDGIHGASLLASQDFAGESEAKRPTVQVGDPLMGKLLMEATLEAIDQIAVEAVQDLGAAGLTSAISELLFQSHVGARMDLDQVPLREEGMVPYEIMLSETQERMVIVVAPDDGDALQAIGKKWDVPMTCIGEIVEDPTLQVIFHQQEVARLPLDVLVGSCPRKSVDPLLKEQVAVRRNFSIVQSSEPFTSEMLYRVLSAPNCRDRSPIYRRYDSTIRAATIKGPGHDAAVLAVKDSLEALAVAVTGPGRWNVYDSFAGGAGAVSRVVRQLVVQGAEPMGLTDGINAGNPDKPDVFGQLAGLIGGIAAAASALDVPVTGGNVSLHNETDGAAIWPTAVIGGVGRVRRPDQLMSDGLRQKDDLILLCNAPDVPDLGGSVWALLNGEIGAYPRPQLDKDATVYRLLRLWQEQWDSTQWTARSVGDGGLAVALARMVIASDIDLGAHVRAPKERTTAWLFNEMSGQVLITAPQEIAVRMQTEGQAHGIAMERLGRVTDDGQLTVQCDRAHRMDRFALARAFRLREDGRTE